jgi:hypothetical protein
MAHATSRQLQISGLLCPIWRAGQSHSAHPLSDSPEAPSGCPWWPSNARTVIIMFGVKAAINVGSGVYRRTPRRSGVMDCDDDSINKH